MAEIQKSGSEALAPVAKDLAALSAKKKTWGERLGRALIRDKIWDPTDLWASARPLKLP